MCLTHSETLMSSVMLLTKPQSLDFQWYDSTTTSSIHSLDISSNHRMFRHLCESESGSELNFMQEAEA